jgi:hypothetical protein
VVTPSPTIEQIRHWEAIGVDRIVSMINYDQVIPHKKVLASLERFAKYVMPEFAEERRTATGDTSKGGPEAPPMPA